MNTFTTRRAAASCGALALLLGVGTLVPLSAQAVTVPSSGGITTLVPVAVVAPSAAPSTGTGTVLTTVTNTAGVTSPSSPSGSGGTGDVLGVVGVSTGTTATPSSGPGVPGLVTVGTDGLLGGTGSTDGTGSGGIAIVAGSDGAGGSLLDIGTGGTGSTGSTGGGTSTSTVHNTSTTTSTTTSTIGGTTSNGGSTTGTTGGSTTGTGGTTGGSTTGGTTSTGGTADAGSAGGGTTGTGGTTGGSTTGGTTGTGGTAPAPTSSAAPAASAAPGVATVVGLSATPSVSVVYPKKDGYRDDVVFRVASRLASGGTAPLSGQAVLTRGSKAISRWTISSSVQDLRWNGLDHGAVVAGIYRLTATVKDAAGASHTATSTVTASPKRLIASTQKVHALAVNGTHTMAAKARSGLSKGIVTLRLTTVAPKVEGKQFLIFQKGTKQLKIRIEQGTHTTKAVAVPKEMTSYTLKHTWKKGQVRLKAIRYIYSYQSLR